MVNKTAVQWLYEQYRKEAIPTDAIVDLFRKAKAMEKEHIKNAYIKGHFDSLFGLLCNSEQYYNENFKSE